MSYTVGDVLLEAQNLLNDSTGQLYPNATLLPFFKKAYREAQRKLQLNSIKKVKFAVVTAPIAASLTPTPFPSQPADLINPLQLHEKNNGDPDYLYIPMSEREWLPDLPPTDVMTYWQWKNEVLTLMSCNTSRIVRLRYTADLVALVAPADTVPINNAQTFLASRTAALAAFCIGEDPDRATALNSDSEVGRDQMVRAGVKENQNTPTRRRAFSIYTRRYR